MVIVRLPHALFVLAPEKVVVPHASNHLVVGQNTNFLRLLFLYRPDSF
jgi:hypothetical protein